MYRAFLVVNIRMKSASPLAMSWINGGAWFPGALELYQEVLCHFNICMDLRNWRRGLSFTKWTKYLIINLKHPKTLKTASHAEVEARVAVMETQNAIEKEKQ